MFRNFQLAAIVRQSGTTRLLRIPLHQSLQESLSKEWHDQYLAFVENAQEIVFSAAYSPEAHERFILDNFELPDWLRKEDSSSAGDLDEITKDDSLLDATRGLAAFARSGDGSEVILFQNFSRSHIIRPGRFLLLQNNTYETPRRPGFALDGKLSAAYLQAERKLLFHSFRTVNTFLPLADYYEEASEQEIREILGHKLLAAENADALAVDSNQWFRKRFAMLRDSGILNLYSAKQIKNRSKGIDVEVQVSDGAIVFPADRVAAKKLLQYLNEELFRGAITKKLYETNSKREAD